MLETTQSGTAVEQGSSHSQSGYIIKEATVTHREFFAKNFRGSIFSTVVLAAALGGIACSAKREVIVPAANALLAPEAESAKGSDSGIEIVVQTNAWDGPRHLDERVVPLKITIQNQSQHPLEVRYSNFALVAADGQRYASIPPYDVSGYSYEPLQPEWAYPGLAYMPVRLPTEQIVERAVAEGTISDGGTTTGFFYFHKPKPKTEAIYFTAVLVDARTRQAFGEIKVPLLLKLIHSDD